MPGTDTALTLDDLSRVPWASDIAAISEHDCWHYCSRFCALASEAEETGDGKNRDVYAFLAQITSLVFKLDQSATPLWPPNRLDSFSESELALLAALAPTIVDPEMQARVADILWLRNHGERGQRDHRMGRLAVTAYLASARRLEDPQHWVLGMERIERAVQVAANLGKSATNQSYADAITYVEEVLDRCDGADPLFLSARLMALLQEQRRGDSAKYAALAEKAARRAEADGEWYRAREYWERKARWHELTNEKEQRIAALAAAAETYIQDAEGRIRATGSNYLTAAALYQDGIDALRHIGGMQERVAQLHKTLLSYQEKGVGEMAVFSTSAPIENAAEYVERARAHVRGKSLPDALFALALVHAPPPKATMERHVRESFKDSPLSDLFARVLVDGRGRTQKRVPSLSSNDPDAARSALENETFPYAAGLRQVIVLTAINPAREQVNRDHNVHVRDFAPLIIHNPLVPHGRESIVARGLHAGLTGDFLVAAHLLIPQLDYGIRSVMERRGVIVSGLEDDGTQPERGLNTTLAHPAAVEIFGEDVIFDLRGLLVEKAGSNLRHAVAHGLLDEGAFMTTEAMYVWWIALHLYAIPVLNGMEEHPGEGAAQSSESE